MLCAGINLETTRFSNISLKKKEAPDFAEFIYEIFRCCNAHGVSVPERFSVLPTNGTHNSDWLLGPEELHMPDRVIWVLLGVVVFSKVNSDKKIKDGYYLSLGGERFTINEWWGREVDFRSIANRFNQVRVGIERLDRLKTADPERSAVFEIKIINPSQI